MGADNTFGETNFNTMTHKIEKLKTGIELITKERQEQIEKHGRTIDKDASINRFDQLRTAAERLINIDRHDIPAPLGWSDAIWERMMNKPYKERLIIAGALIAAEIDRLNFLKVAR